MKDVAAQILERWVEFKDWKINLRCNLYLTLICYVPLSKIFKFQSLFLIYITGMTMSNSTVCLDNSIISIQKKNM